MNSPFLIKLQAYETHEDNSMCASINQVETFHDYYLNTVHEELIRRNQISLYYLEQELWAILYSIICAATYLEDNGRSLYDVRPQNIYFTQQGDVKLVPFGLFPDDLTGYQKFMTLNEPVLLSPELILSSRVKNFNPNINYNKSDVYSIGMTMLYCASLQTMNQCYNYDNLQINAQVLNQLQVFTKGEYSKFFNNIVSLMLTENPDDRPTCQFFYSILSPFEEQILNLQPFNPDYETLRRHLEYVHNPYQLSYAPYQPQQQQQQQKGVSQSLRNSQVQTSNRLLSTTQKQHQSSQSQNFTQQQNLLNTAYLQSPASQSINNTQYSNQYLVASQQQPQLVYNENTQYILQQTSPHYQYQDQQPVYKQVNNQAVGVQSYQPLQSIAVPSQTIQVNNNFTPLSIPQKVSFGENPIILENQNLVYNSNPQIQSKKVTFVEKYNQSPIKMINNDVDQVKRAGKRDGSVYQNESNEDYDMNEINKRINDALQRTQEILRGGK